jgi:hypothetical protein
MASATSSASKLSRWVQAPAASLAARAFGHGLCERDPVDRDGEQELGGKCTRRAKNGAAAVRAWWSWRSPVRIAGVCCRSAAHAPPAPLPSPLQELRPVVHVPRWPFGVRWQDPGEHMFQGHVPAARRPSGSLSASRITVSTTWGYRPGGSAWPPWWPMPGCRSVTCRLRLSQTLRKCQSSALAVHWSRRRRSREPRRACRCSWRSWIEKDPLDGGELARFTHRDEQSGLKLDQPSLSSRTARMIAQVVKRSPDVA